MAYDGFVIRAITSELSNELIGSRIEKIYQPEKDELIIRTKSKKHLLLSANSMNPRIYITERFKSNPENPTAFCMLLRKLFQGGVITDVSQRSSERIVDISIDCNDEMGYIIKRQITFELMGKHSNIIAIEDGKIIDSIKRIPFDKSRYRQVLPGLLYESPPDHGKISFDEVSRENLYSVLGISHDKLASEAEAENGVSQGKLKQVPEVGVSQGKLLPGVGVRQDKLDSEAVPGVSHDKLNSAPGETLKDSIIKKIQGIGPLAASYLSEDINTICDKISRLSSVAESPDSEYYVFFDEKGNPKDFYLIDFPHFEKRVSFKSLNSALDFYYDKFVETSIVQRQGGSLKATVNSKLNKLLLKKERLTNELSEAESSEDLRLYGELLTANLHVLKRGMDEAEVINYYDQKPVTIPLDKRLIPQANAQRYYKLYGKAKTAVREKKIQIEETISQIEYFESLLNHIDNAETEAELSDLRKELTDSGLYSKHKKDKKVKEVSKPLKVIIEDFTVYIGKNNLQNDRLVREGHRNDIWLHTKDIPGSHVIIRSDGKDVPESVIKKAAGFAAYYSKARLSENVPVDFVLLKFVRKPNGAKPGKVTFFNNKTIYVNPAVRQN